jgi:photosystem II stability/assembly factor-like uncharacterized protein
VVYVTHDVGRTWQARPASASAAGPPANWGFPKALTFSAGTARDWFLFVAPRLYATHDAGLSWTALHPRGAPRRALGVWDLSFSSDANGWALFLNHLVATSDGGRTWHPVGP